MNISYNWLKEYIDIPFSTEELADKMTMAGIEVEAMKESNSIPRGVVVGEILERNQHPDANKLSVCKVSSGNGEIHQVVCGAPNCDAGKKIPFATLGTVFINPETNKKLKIKKTKLRGIESSGMLCSARELELSSDHAGLLELPLDITTGTPVSEIFKSDTAYELEITPNRPDCLSHWGIAREITAYTGNKVKFPNSELPIATKAEDKGYGDVEVIDSDLCPRYTARIIKGVKISESPEWLKNRLQSIGLRPINNIVDITNFVMFELGHPLHAFDLKELDGNKIIVRKAKDGEKIKTLDEKDLILKHSHLVIADATKPVALAGVMGGEHSGVTENTVDILLESAIFNSSNIRATSKKLGISSDSSYRFERGVDFEMAATASARAAFLILEIAGGELVGDFIDIKTQPSAKKPVKCQFSNVRSLIGVDIKNSVITKMFKNLGFTISAENPEGCKVISPSYRLDIEREADLIEEVARLYGLDNIPLIQIKATPGGSIKSDAYTKQEQLRDQLISIGLNECLNYVLISEKQALSDGSFTKSDLLRVINPISIEGSILRPSLLYGMLNSVKHNVSHNNHDYALFEIGRIFSGKEKESEEKLSTCIAISGRKNPERFSDEKNLAYDFFDIKGLLETWLESRKIKRISCKSSENPIFRNGNAAEMYVNNRPLISFGEINPKLVRDIRLRYPLFIAVIKAQELIDIPEPKISYKAIPSFPATTRDVAVIAGDDIDNASILECINKSGCKWLEKAELFDIYQDNSLGSAKKSLAYSLTFRNPDRTLTDKEVNSAHEKIRKRLESELSLELR